MKFENHIEYNEHNEILMPVLEIFLSCNGEGLDVGKPVTFVRLVGCNLRCCFGKCGHCDTPESLLFPTQYRKNGLVKCFNYMTAKEVADKIKEHGTKRVTLTGGNPLSRGGIGKWIHDLMEELGDGVLLELEENGSIDINIHLLRYLNEEERKRLRITLDYKTISSKMNHFMLLRNWDFLNEDDVIKCVVGNREDMEDAVAKIKERKPKAQIIFSPVFNEIELKEIWEFACEPDIIPLDIKVQVQLHKIAYPWDMRGV